MAVGGLTLVSCDSAALLVASKSVSRNLPLKKMAKVKLASHFIGDLNGCSGF
jgi:hypothetical protein